MTSVLGRKPLTPKQRELARHALGLPNRNRRSYRNRFVCEETEPNWSQMIADGYATMRSGATLPFGGNTCFYLTLAGAKAALDPREKLCDEDFPASVTNPILFSAPMVRALIDGSKTQTRRLFKGQITPYGFGAYLCDDTVYGDNEKGWENLTRNHAPVKVGTRLWVREAWRCNGFATDVATIMYKAHENCSYTEMTEQFSVVGQKYIEPTGTWKPSIHMPRWISRLTLQVTDVRIQRLQDISEEDAIAEGVEKDSDGWRSYAMPHTQICASARDSFQTLWDSLNADRGSWDSNPWIVAYSFKVHHSNIDAVLS